jgi:hypothetical protein
MRGRMKLTQGGHLTMGDVLRSAYWLCDVFPVLGRLAGPTANLVPWLREWPPVRGIPAQRPVAAGRRRAGAANLGALFCSSELSAARIFVR